jgi:ribonuclease HII
MAYLKYKIWVDEAGRGPWAGPVVACSLAFNPHNSPSKEFLDTINDSKKLSSKKRDFLYEKLIAFSTWENPSVFFWVGVVDNYMIDEINIRQANKEAMRRALVEIQRKIDVDQIESVLIDGKDNYVFDELKRKAIYIVWWDAKVVEIGAASIIAKVFRDKLMKQYASLYPDHGFDLNAWYGTKKHQEILKAPTQITWIHRTSYKPVKAALEKKPKLILHVCCWPDATVPIVDLKRNYEVIAFWYDPNIQPKAEYDKRLEAFIKVCEIEWVERIEGEYDVKNFFSRIKWLEDTPERWEKCTECYDMRLERTARLATEMWVKYWTSSLNNSPHKDMEKMFKLGEKWSTPSIFNPLLEEQERTLLSFGHLPLSGEKIQKLEFLKIAFRKNGGFQRSVDYTKKYDIYRQNYCGCVYSDTFPGSERAKGKKVGFSG